MSIWRGKKEMQYQCNKQWLWHSYDLVHFPEILMVFNCVLHKIEYSFTDLIRAPSPGHSGLRQSLVPYSWQWYALQCLYRPNQRPFTRAQRIATVPCALFFILICNANVYFRPNQSPFTRAQRIATVTCALFLTMICSAMFYKSSEEVERPSVIKLGPVNITMQELYVSCVTAAIVFPTTMFVTLVFRNSNTKQKKDDKDKAGLF